MPKAKRKKILIADDSVVAFKHLSNIISEKDYEVVGHAKNGAEVLKMYKELRPDIVLLDLVMPIMTGLEALDGLMQIDLNAKVVVISSIGGVGQKAIKALEMGAKNVITKPFHEEAVLRILKEL
ncbi:MAG: hypothetical protein A2Y62_05270 [Candidatus Fischerbacteria bacterium RBG_13_37_8]|uniref:Response regulatory domain-containing protein n=1 Tax=Candidatus Fischerbacteria bacterium RBG_13_37_8 TaxID=1817863 RepID=A0A1F5VXX4_9BACT|nr:MAG: hypothetical protein A2Y62_05270 [Candidatus Fischerbacteria bacterium RBG_13_37_8]